MGSSFKISKTISTPKRLMEQEKRGSFLLQKETPAEYVHIRSSLRSFHSNSEVVSRKGSTASVESDLDITEETITLEPMRSSSTIKLEDVEDNIIGKKLVPQSTLVADITKTVQFCDIVGKGGFATVREGILVGTRENVAVKIFNKWELSDEALIFIKREIGTLSELNHPNIRQFRKIFEDNHYLYVVMEYIKGESLYDYVERMEKLEESQAKTIVHSLLEILEYLHTSGYIHQDIKTENILLPQPTAHEIEFDKMKLIDFGFCREIRPGELLREYCGSYHYLAPEMISREPYGVAVDLWSVGVVLYILLAGLRPFFSQEEARQAKIQWFEEDWEEISKEARGLVVALLDPNPSTRLTATQALTHPWFQLD